MLHKISDPLIINGKSLVFGNYILVIYNKLNTVKNDLLSVPTIYSNRTWQQDNEKKL